MNDNQSIVNRIRQLHNATPNEDMTKAIMALRHDLKNLAASIVAKQAQQEGNSSPIFKLIAHATPNNSLAWRIRNQTLKKQ